MGSDNIWVYCKPHIIADLLAKEVICHHPLSVETVETTPSSSNTAPRSVPKPSNNNKRDNKVPLVEPLPSCSNAVLVWNERKRTTLFKPKTEKEIAQLFGFPRPSFPTDFENTLAKIGLPKPKEEVSIITVDVREKEMNKGNDPEATTESSTEQPEPVRTSSVKEERFLVKVPSGFEKLTPIDLKKEKNLYLIELFNKIPQSAGIYAHLPVHF